MIKNEIKDSNIFRADVADEVPNQLFGCASVPAAAVTVLVAVFASISSLS